MRQSNSLTVTRAELAEQPNVLEWLHTQLLDAGCPLAVNGEVASFDQREVFQYYSIDGEALTFSWEVSKDV